MEAQRTCRLIKERFAGREETIERLFRRSETFRCLCRDYLACAAVLNWWERSDLERARRYARRWVDLNPLSERAHRQLMDLLALSNRRREALQQYQTCCRILKAELETEPGPETTALYEHIRTGRMTMPTPRAPAPPASNLPLPMTPFVGRENELAYATRLLVRPECRLLTLVGLGGVGKTRLALQIA